MALTVGDLIDELKRKNEEAEVVVVMQTDADEGEVVDITDVHYVGSALHLIGYGRDHDEEADEE